VPLHALLQFPDDRFAVGGEAAVLHTRNLRREDRDVVAIVVVGRERLVEDPRAFLVLGPDGKVGIQQRCALPPQQLQRAAATALGRLVRALGLRVRDPGPAQQSRGHRCGKTERGDRADKSASRKLAVLDGSESVPEALSRP
jgi:hypothetical protein